MGLTTVAIAPYFGYYLGLPEFKDQVSLMSVDDLFTEITVGNRTKLKDTNPNDWVSLPDGGALAETYRWMDQYDAMASVRDLNVVAYEGGQHLAAVGDAINNTAIVDLFQAANRDPRMGTIYTDYLNHWKATPNRRLGLFIPFLLAERYGKFGSWGVLEYINQQSSPKYDALMSFVGANACWWLNCEIGSPVSALLQPLMVAINGAGAVISSPAGISCGMDCTETLAAGSSVTLTAVPSSNATFAGWGGSCAGGSLTCTLTMDAAKTVTANFAPIYSLTVTNSNSTYGVVTSDVGGVSCGVNCTTKLTGGSTIKLTAKPNGKRKFAGWSGACSGSSTTCTISNVNGNKSVTAKFR
jgi:hypothetical protein